MSCILKRYKLFLLLSFLVIVAVSCQKKGGEPVPYGVSSSVSVENKSNSKEGDLDDNHGKNNDGIQGVEDPAGDEPGDGNTVIGGDDNEDDDDGDNNAGDDNLGSGSGHNDDGRGDDGSGDGDNSGSINGNGGN